MGKSSKLYNKDLAPTPNKEKKWGWPDSLDQLGDELRGTLDEPCMFSIPVD